MTLGDGTSWNYGYDGLGQVTSGKQSWENGTPIPGEQFEYTFDDIGNRTQSKRGGNTNGLFAVSRVSAYSLTTNNVNAYASRSVVPDVNIIGLIAWATITVNGVAVDYRRGEYFEKILSVGNATAPAAQSVTVTAGKTGITGNEPSSPTNQVFSYDLDGNKTSDSVWTYIYDGESRLIEVKYLTTLARRLPASSEVQNDIQRRRALLGGNY